jgi:hypothetical protein
LISVGANDVYFGPVATFCLTHRNCPDRRFNPGKPGRVAPRGTPTARDVVRKRISRLPVLYERLARELKGIVPPERVFLSEYFDPTHDTHGHLCKLIGPPVLGITEEEARWAHDDLLVPLDAEIEAAAARHGWNAVTGIATAFGNHGYCAGPERWIRTIGESLRLLGTGGGKARLAGSLHPNAEGHKQIAVFLSGALQSRLHAPATARPSQPDPPDSGDPGGGAETPVAIALAGLGGLGLLGVPLARRWRKRRDRDGDQGGTHDEGVSAPSPVVETHASAWAAPESLHGEIAELLLTSSEWIHRRVDSVELLDDRTARRRVSVDFTLPRSSAARTRHAPLLLLRKQPLSNFDLRDEDGRPVPLLTRRQTGKITTSILVRLADAIAGTPLPGELIDACAAIAQGSPAEASRAMRFIATDLQPEPLRERIRRDVTFRELATTLVASFPVIVPVRDGDERRILKLAYDEPVAPSRGVLSALGWWGFSMLVDLPYLSASGSHHLEVRQSPGLEHVDAVLVTRNPDGTRTRTWQPGPASATHFYAGDAPRGSRGLAIVRMRTRREGLLRSGPVFAAATALALTGAWFALPGIATKAADVGPLLLAFPAVLAAFLASTGEHPIASRLLLGARTLVFASGLWSFLAAAALALNPSVLTLRWTLGAMALLGWLTFAALVATLALPRPRSPEERRRDGVA